MAMPRSSLLWEQYRLFKILIFAALLLLADARKHTLKLQEDSRRLVQLTSFGFNKNGYLAVKISDMMLAKEGEHSYGFTLDKSLHNSGELISIWDGKTGECPLSNVNDTGASLVFFLVEITNDGHMQLRLFRNGDLKNLTITLQDRITNNLTDTLRGKRSAYKVPLSSSPRQKRSVAENTIANNFTTAVALTAERDSLPSAPADDASVDLIPGLTRQKSSGLNYYEAIFTVLILDEIEVGSYTLAFHKCEKEPTTTFNLTVEMVENNDGNFLSVGQMPLPIMYFVLSVIYFLIGSLWFYILCSSQEGVFKIHYLMLALMYIKSTSLLFHGVNYHFIEAKGQQEEAFAILFYIVYLMRGIFMFATIVLIGAGWTFVKHILSDRDKKIFVIVIPLQILTNVANIILSESEEGQSTYAMWKHLFILVDLLCCGAILFPVVWSIRHLQQASQTDGKAAINLEKLKIFRHFYILVVCYIYFTRIIVLLMSITVPFRYEWLGECCVEVATLAFFMLTGYKFRPASNNPYLQVPQSDDETEMEVVTQSGALEGITRVNVKSKKKENEEPLLKQRENSHEYD